MLRVIFVGWRFAYVTFFFEMFYAKEENCAVNSLLLDQVETFLVVSCECGIISDSGDAEMGFFDQSKVSSLGN